MIPTPTFFRVLFQPARLAALLCTIALLSTADRAQAAELTYREVKDWAQFPANAKGAMMTAVDIDSKGTIYVFQRGEPARVLAFDPNGKLLRSFGEGKFGNPHGLRVDRQDNVWITDRGLQQVIKFSPTGEVLLELGKKGVAGNNTSTDALNGAADVAWGANGDIFVADGEGANTRVVKFSADGKFIKCWGTKGPGPGQLDTPHSIAIDSKGRLLVANRGNKRVEIFGQDGAYLGVINDTGTPYGLFLTKNDVLYLTDGTQGKDDLTIIDLKTQQHLGHFGGLVGPHMLAVDAAGSIYVAETRGNAVRKFVKQ